MMRDNAKLELIGDRHYTYPERDPKQMRIERLEQQVDRLICMNDHLRAELEGEDAV